MTVRAAEGAFERSWLRVAAAFVALVFLLAAAGAVPARAAEGHAPAPGSALTEGIPFGLNAFERNAKGTARSIDGQPEGYRFPLGEGATLALVRTPDAVLVWVDAEAAAAAGFDPASAADVAALKEQIEGLDRASSLGGALLANVTDPWEFTTESEVVRGAYVYRFAVAGTGRAAGDAGGAGPAGGTYLTVTAAPGADIAPADLGDGALWSDDARLVPASEVATVASPGPLDRAAAFLAGIDYRPLGVSIKTGGLALAISLALGLAAAWRTCGTSGRLKGLLDSVFTIPMVLPPTVCGFLLLMLFGQSTVVGRWLIAHGVSVVFTWPAAVIAAVVVSFPLVYRTALGAFEALDPQMLDAARTLGWSEWRIFRRLMLPLGWPSIAAGAVLAFARAMGEFGCTLFFAGNYAGITQTIPIAIYFEWMGGNTAVALFWVIVVIAFSFAVILAINLYTARSGAYRSRTGAGARARGSAAFDSRDALEAEAAGGDALRLDREALRELLGEPWAGEGGA